MTPPLACGFAVHATLMFLAGCADAILLHPPKTASAPSGAQVRTVPLDDGSLQIWTRRADPANEPRAFVLEFCGNATRAEYIVNDSAMRWRQANAEVWAVNYPGFGGSSGSATLRSIAPAALRAYDALREVAGDRPIFVAGRSIGTTAALHVAAHRPVAGVLLHSPAPLRQVIFGQFGWWNLWIGATLIAAQVPRDLDALTNAAGTTAPAIFIVSEKDELVWPKYQRRVIEAYRGPKQTLTLDDADHNTPPSPAEETQIQQAIGRMIGNPSGKLSTWQPPKT